MILKVIIDEQCHEINVPDALLAEAQDYFDQLDLDMGRGWRMGRDWVDQPDRLQRCQIVADRLLTALETENSKLAALMAGYILARLPGVEAVEPDIQGEMHNTCFEMRQTPAEAPAAASTRPGAVGPSKLEAMEQAGRDVTQVFKVGRGYRFSVFDHVEGAWRDSPLASTEQEASRLRQQAFKARYEELLGLPS